ncbi:MAG: DegT/DnrJ/EryC1/StrS aminotransferase family protein [Clostridium sp.]|jgi:dTDP-4-amino-4,6-dideoxygalactose transaminase|uniref:DegT/DnrJ/EryC1/StrS family aminotransferase n=1 Tax=Clostridium sp. TaxID=1506 RepID=UPI0025C46017|nr:DegT/DnrJ/EryC1/StrS aminotransferase family protein [Clostridium sp.]MCH3963149.1 DegT/DnrJ/EryC1/StrS aminotransferase family protein [Clostridium sp.]MCI1716388.1 DegT/DnrJ/EryC1/StrS aminotransferase family protein [Clostridium sp.]MCI1800728.1 DegT/DnrJ/EryC1/StrS aminotransferase family protein [Clostridium sp.]MCI1814617.1 DegT/DnrJ/EryC1/StrS aminotransferase family protein [Clostridium sp.]MCI1871527.1 DegT/DnrJ/EryC1/StrS aminotransferase family protein [Clostridium sp.]
MNRKISFSPPDITQDEINAAIEVLKSGWITTGPKTAEFEKQLAEYCKANHAVAVGNATAGLELLLQVFDIKEGDDVITTPYTYTATASVSIHRGIKPTFVDVKKDTFLIDIDKLYDAIKPNTKAIYSVDIAGVPVDYDKIHEVLRAKGREDILLVADSAHAFGASYKGKKVGSQLDAHVFSFHAVKNLTTAEGGAVTFNDNELLGKKDLTKDLKLMSLHGQSKDALSKMKAGAWKYDIIYPGYKCNMTDINAAIGLVQLSRYENMLKRRKVIFDVYTDALKDKDWAIIPFERQNDTVTSYHLYTLRLRNFKEKDRNEVIKAMADRDIATNVHFTPLPMFTAYKNFGYSIKDYPNAYEQYKNEITLPMYSTLSKGDAEYVIENLIDVVEKIKK